MSEEKNCDNCRHNVLFGICEITDERVPFDEVEMPCDGDDWESE